MNDRAMQRWAAELREARRWTEQQAREVLRKQRESGEGVARFAQRMGVSPQRLFWWRTRLFANGRDGVDGAVRVCSTPRLVPVVVRQRAQDEAGYEVPVVVWISDHVRVDVREPDASTAAWVALLAAGCTDSGGLR